MLENKDGVRKTIWLSRTVIAMTASKITLQFHGEWISKVIQHKGNFDEVFGFSETKSSLISNYSLILQLCSVFGKYTHNLQPELLLGALSTGIPIYSAYRNV